MNIVHVNNVDLIGSRFNGHDLQIELNKRGISSKQIVIEKLGCDNRTTPLYSNLNNSIVGKMCIEFEKALSIRALVHPHGWHMMKTPEFVEADIIHYHLIHNNLLSLAMLPDLVRMKPTVITLHDAWIFSGHCVHSLGCEKWRYGCGKCEKHDVSFPIIEDTTSFMWKVKKRVFEDITLDVVVASKYMLNMAKTSPITRHLENMHYIPFGIDEDMFVESDDKGQVRKQLGINCDDFVILLRTDPSPFKGMDIITKMLDELCTNKPITLLTVGQGEMLVKYSDKFTIKQFEWITNDELMAQVYQACDILVMPSKAESFGMMAVEAMASKRPVIVMDGTALPSVTFAPDCGIVIPRENSHIALKHVVDRLIQNPQECTVRGKKGRELVEKHYKFQTYVDKHIDLYYDILKR
ncbi:MAG: glycosyltransferase [Oscillospiraceae bacterium]|nr:glycosyltransferase [Oscillospiraceae bacterium]